MTGNDESLSAGVSVVYLYLVYLYQYQYQRIILNAIHEKKKQQKNATYILRKWKEN